MQKRKNSKSARSKQKEQGITRITVSGFKSISKEQSIDIRPLTILAGANSSGKSSIMQPLLLMKQTLQASYDPGALRLDGPNVQFSSMKQFLSHIKGGQRTDFKVGIHVGDQSVHVVYSREAGEGVNISQTTIHSDLGSVEIHPGMSHEELKRIIPQDYVRQELTRFFPTDFIQEIRFVVSRERCFLKLEQRSDKPSGVVTLATSPYEIVGFQIRDILHFPGWRGNPARTYSVAATDQTSEGTFERYIASIISKWQEQEDYNLETLKNNLKDLGLTWTVSAHPIEDAKIELRVGRLPQPVRGDVGNTVNIVDVGFGVSQTLPILVALLAAEPGQLVYIEQPELHLHPNAQVKMAQVLANAAKRGVKVIAETHSSLLLLAVQSLIAEGELPPELVKLHWFQRREDGTTLVSSADIDEAGAFGEWPEDFAEVALEAESRYLDAVSLKQLGRKN